MTTSPTNRFTEQFRSDALEIWRAGLDAVRPARLLPEWVQVDGGTLVLGDLELSLAEIDHIEVIGVGKAGAEMAAALETALGETVMAAKSLSGWVNVPADCLGATQRIHLHAARPAGVNEPTAEALAGTLEIIRRVSQLGPRDLCLCLISGGGSAMLELPIEGFALEDMIALTREMSARGATIQQMNAVRRSLSQVKAGGLLRACRAGRLVSLVLSDVLGDDLSIIASGPTIPLTSDPQAALRTLADLGLACTPLGERAATALAALSDPEPQRRWQDKPSCEATNLLIGNNAAAVDAAGVVAERLGYSHAMTSATKPEGTAEEVAAHLVQMVRTMRRAARSGIGQGPDCLISGGEPVVKLAPAAGRGRGGRNQQLCLAALAELEDWRGVALVSGGTDGEDGPTDAAGAVVDEQGVERAKSLQLDPGDYLARNDAYTFFEQTGGLIKTGPTGTNVCDLRVVTVASP